MGAQRSLLPFLRKPKPKELKSPDLDTEQQIPIATQRNSSDLKPCLALWLWSGKRRNYFPSNWKQREEIKQEVETDSHCPKKMGGGYLTQQGSKARG